MHSPLHILHITEASAAGVLHSAGQLARLQAALGAEVTFAYIPREDTPGPSTLDTILDGVRHVAFGQISLGLLGRIRAINSYLRSAIRSGEYDVIHLHSSLAGVAGRMFPLGQRFSGVLCYSPHGFAFLRQDVHPIARVAFKVAEQVGARRGTVLAVSESEKSIANTLQRRKTALALPNAVETDKLPIAEPDLSRARPLIGMVGRIVYPRAPWRFAALAKDLQEHADFVWIGDGSDDDKARWIGDAPIQITGWLDQNMARERIRDLDLICFPTLWEGMPLSLLDAQAIGIPAVASRIVGNTDVVIDNETGLLFDTIEELHEHTFRLLGDPGLRRAMGHRARVSAIERFDAHRVATESLQVYRSLNATSNRA